MYYLQVAFLLKTSDNKNLWKNELKKFEGPHGSK